jgi:hypothetical protein
VAMSWYLRLELPALRTSTFTDENG